jgi:hypothetical protein
MPNISPPISIDDLDKMDDAFIRNMQPLYLIDTGNDPEWIKKFESRIEKIADCKKVLDMLSDDSNFADGSKISKIVYEYENLNSDVERFGTFTRFCNIVEGDKDKQKRLFSSIGNNFLAAKKRIEEGKYFVTRQNVVGENSSIKTEKMNIKY